MSVSPEEILAAHFLRHRAYQLKLLSNRVKAQLHNHIWISYKTKMLEEARSLNP
jgi:hypothetical protein